MTYWPHAIAAALTGADMLLSCSVVNAPDDEQEPGAGAQGAGQTTGGGGAGTGGSSSGVGGSGGEAGGGGCGPLNTLENCGACGVPCEPEHATGATCTTGSCEVGVAWRVIVNKTCP